MLIVRAARAAWILLRQHFAVAVAAFILAGGLAYLAGTRWPKQYTGTAIIALDAKTAVDQGHQHEAIAALLQQLPTEQDLGGIVTNFHLYPDAIAPNDISRAGVRLLSQVSINEIETDDRGHEAVQLSYSGEDKDLVSGVTNALAQSFTRPVNAPAPPEPVQESAPPLPPTTQPVQEAAPAPPPAPMAPVAVPVHHARVKSRNRKHSHAPAKPVNTAAIQRKLDAAEKEEIALEAAAKQNGASAMQLKRERARLIAAATPKPAPPPVPEHRPSVEQERLQQQLADAKARLTQLRVRYTEEYPDVIATRERVQELQNDLNRIIAAQPAPQPAPVKKPPVDTSVLASINNEESQSTEADLRLQQEIEHNQAEIASLQFQLKRALSHPAVEASTNDEDDEDDSAAATTDGSQTLAAIPNLDTTAITPPPVLPPPSASPILLSSFVIVQNAVLRISPAILNRQFLWPLSVVFGLLAAMLAVYFAERHDPSIKNEGMLRHEMPASAVYLGGVPRIRHEVIVD